MSQLPTIEMVGFLSQKSYKGEPVNWKIENDE